MEKEFIPYELALELKELGFDEPCFGFYTEEYKKLIKNFCKYPINLPTKPFLAPTFSQAFRFFRETYLLFGYPFPNDYQKYGYRIVEMSSDGNKELVYDWGTKDSVEEAELECLKKLIEIVKQK